MWETDKILVKKLNNLNALLLELSTTEEITYNLSNGWYEINPRFKELKNEIYIVSSNINGYLEYLNNTLTTKSNKKHYLHINYAEYKAEII